MVYISLFDFEPERLKSIPKKYYLNADSILIFFDITNDNLQFRNALNGISAPIYKGKTFINFVDEENNTYTLDDIKSIDKDIKLIARYE